LTGHVIIKKKPGGKKMNHHNSSDTGVSRKKRAQGIQWQLEDENPGQNCFKGGLRGVGEGGGTNHPLKLVDKPPEIPPPPTQPQYAPAKKAFQEDPLVLAMMQDWLESHGITCINLLLRSYTVERLKQAISDFERATRYPSRFIPRDNTAYFRSLLK
jgi:hypothetical protein